MIALETKPEQVEEPRRRRFENVWHLPYPAVKDIDTGEILDMDDMLPVTDEDRENA